MRRAARGAAILWTVYVGVSTAGRPPANQQWMFEKTFESKTVYSDAFNDVDVDVIFEKEGKSGRVPTFWRGSNQGTVRFTPPTSGEYTYHVKSTDKKNSDLNRHKAQANITAYTGSNTLL